MSPKALAQPCKTRFFPDISNKYWFPGISNVSTKLQLTIWLQKYVIYTLMLLLKKLVKALGSTLAIFIRIIVFGLDYSPPQATVFLSIQIFLSDKLWQKHRRIIIATSISIKVNSWHVRSKTHFSYFQYILISWYQMSNVWVKTEQTYSAKLK